MLKVEHRFMIKTLYQRGLCISEIAEITGHNRRTVRKIINGPVSPEPKKRRAKGSRLDPFVPHLKKRIDEGVLNCSKLLAEIEKQGYQGGKTFSISHMCVTILIVGSEADQILPVPRISMAEIAGDL